IVECLRFRHLLSFACRSEDRGVQSTGISVRANGFDIGRMQSMKSTFVAPSNRPSNVAFDPIPRFLQNSAAESTRPPLFVSRTTLSIPNAGIGQTHSRLS